MPTYQRAGGAGGFHAGAPGDTSHRRASRQCDAPQSDGHFSAVDMSIRRLLIIVVGSCCALSLVRQAIDTNQQVDFRRLGADFIVVSISVLPFLLLAFWIRISKGEQAEKEKLSLVLTCALVIDIVTVTLLMTL